MRSRCPETNRPNNPCRAQTDTGTDNPGYRTGSLTVIGLGPGDVALLPPMAQDALKASDLIVGYTGYARLLPDHLAQGKEIMVTGMRHELERAELAITSCQKGRHVVVISSGDAGVYGMAGLILEFLDKKGLQDSLPCTIVPGIPALCAAAALLGAPLMHDFAAISLSDLLTPWELILKRVEAAARADFVIVLYNPKSRRRTDQLQTALTIIKNHQGMDIPVGSVRRAYRKDQTIRTARLGDFEADHVDMTTIVIVGNSQTMLRNNRMITPRGYFGKYDMKTFARKDGAREEERFS